MLKSPTPANADFFGFVGRGALMRRLYAQIAAAAHTTSPVFISGETGSGKDMTAKALHDGSARAAGPFVVLNCAALPRDLVESELFGHRRGAFTGAGHDHNGAFARADGGTLFLDEITEMPASLQAKLLRAVETGCYTPLGEGRERKADIRVVAASNRPPLLALQDGRLREDLFYRLAGLEIAVPPLRARGQGDIDLLCDYFLARISPAAPPSLTAEARQWLGRQSWPGNLRQLENLLRQAVVFHGAATIGLEHLPAETAAPPAQPAADDETLAAAETRLIAQAVARHRGNLAAAARSLGVDVSTLHRKRRRGMID